ncbi:hypothetical protein, partial [Pseudoalteromonas sp. PPB1]|uniref:hypothetical protein n=1 Tax=Pseudoalteromonas sp. PPB1 TaxID=2756136 RepID=UPI001E337F05
HFLSWIFSLFGELNKFRRLQNHYHIDGNWILTLDHKFNQFGIIFETREGQFANSYAQVTQQKLTAHRF